MLRGELVRRHRRGPSRAAAKTSCRGHLTLCRRPLELVRSDRSEFTSNCGNWCVFCSDAQICDTSSGATVAKYCCRRTSDAVSGDGPSCDGSCDSPEHREASYFYEYKTLGGSIPNVAAPPAQNRTEEGDVSAFLWMKHSEGVLVSHSLRNGLFTTHS